jgi:hypothetical protein
MAVKTTGEEMLDQVRKISEALDFLLKKGLPESLLTLWIHKKTHISQTDIKAVLDALKSVSKDFTAPATVPR